MCTVLYTRHLQQSGQEVKVQCKPDTGRIKKTEVMPIVSRLTEYVLIEAHALIDAHHPSAKINLIKFTPSA